MPVAAGSLSGRLLALALLVSLTSCFVDQQQLEKLKDLIQRTDKVVASVEKRRPDFDEIFLLLAEYKTLTPYIKVLMKKGQFAFEPVESFIGQLADFLKNHKLHDDDQGLRFHKASLQGALREYRRLVAIFEDQYYEL